MIRSDNGSEKIVLADIGGNVLYTLPNPAGYLFDELTWSDTGRYLAATVYLTESGSSQIWVYDLKDQTNIPEPTIYGMKQNAFNPVWHRDTLAFVQFHLGSTIWTVDPGQEPQMVSDKYPTITEPAWSPDGKQIAFTCTTSLWDDNERGLPDDLGICTVTLGSTKIGHILPIGSSKGRYPFWFQGKIAWIAIDKNWQQSVAMSTQTYATVSLFGSPYIEQVGTPLVNGNDVYLSEYRLENPSSEKHIWITVKYTCSGVVCQRSNIQLRNRYLPSLSIAGIFAYGSLSSEGKGQVFIFDTNTHKTVLMVSTDEVEYFQPVCQP